MYALKSIRKILNTRTDSEHEQNIIRLGFGVIISFYVFYLVPHQEISEIWIDLLLAVLVFWSVAIAIFILILLNPKASPVRRIVGIAVDIGVLSIIMAMMEDYGAILFALYLWVTVGNGLRYGQVYLITAMCASMLGFTTVIVHSNYWSSNYYTAIGVLIALIALPLYFSKLLQRLNVVNQSLERRVAERTEELAIARDQALASNSAKDRFLANMSHELRTPLNAIIGYSELLAEEAVIENRMEEVLDLECIQSSSHHLLGIISDMLDLTNINADKIQISNQVFSVGEFLHEIINTVEPLMKKNQNQLDLVEPFFTGTIVADKIKLKQVLLNLLSNAGKFTSNGNIKLQVQRNVVDDVPSVTFSVTDNGIGIPQDKLLSIFEAFNQVDSGYTRQYGGNGLGLTISRRLCELMGGHLAVESELNKGATFKTTIPLKNKIINC